MVKESRSAYRSEISFINYNNINLFLNLDAMLKRPTGLNTNFYLSKLIIIN